MISLPGKVTNLLKNSWARWMPPFSVRDSNQDSKPHTDLKRIVQTGVLDPDILVKHLRHTSLYGSNGAAVKEVQIRRVLKFHVGKRCTLEVALRTEGGWQFLVAKIYRKDRSDVFQAMKGIRQCGFGPQDEFSISQPVGYAPSLRCLLQEKVDGTTADAIFKAGDDTARIVAAERCAMWLARFHSLVPGAGPICHPKDFVNSKPMQRWARKVAMLEGCFGDKAARLYHRVEGASGSLQNVELKAGHGSYNAAHIFLSKDRTVTIDWDWHDISDPARDVARFLYALRRWALDQLGSIRALDKPAEVFLTTYLAAGLPLAEKNFRFFGATTCLNLAMRHLFDEGPIGRERQEKAEAMLDEGFRVLDGETI
jgi:aminoglycoside phosphotransferase (APT) family kinase protein